MYYIENYIKLHPCIFKLQNVFRQTDNKDNANKTKHMEAYIGISSFSPLVQKIHICSRIVYKTKAERYGSNIFDPLPL